MDLELRITKMVESGWHPTFEGRTSDNPYSMAINAKAKKVSQDRKKIYLVDASGRTFEELMTALEQNIILTEKAGNLL